MSAIELANILLAPYGVAMTHNCELEINGAAPDTRACDRRPAIGQCQECGTHLCKTHAYNCCGQLWCSMHLEDHQASAEHVNELRSLIEHYAGTEYGKLGL